MSTEDVLASIDAACADWEVGPDAARFNADPEATAGDQWHMNPGIITTGTRVTLPPGVSTVWFATIDDDGQPGEWHEVGTLNAGPFAPLSDRDQAPAERRADVSHFQGPVDWPSVLSRRGLMPLGDAAYRTGGGG